MSAIRREPRTRSGHVNEEKTWLISNANMVSNKREQVHALVGSILGDAVKALLGLAADVAHVHVGALGGRAVETSRGAILGAGVGLDLAGADVDVAGVGGLPVGGDGGLLGKGEVGLNLGDLLVLGLSHGCG
jgi:hypothetical protein